MLTQIRRVSKSSQAKLLQDASLKDNKAVAAAHVYEDGNIHKIKHYTMNVTSTEAELFAIRYGINGALSHKTTNYIIVVINTIHAAEKILNTSHHPLQLHTIAISQQLKDFFKRSPNYCISFWDPYQAVNNNAKSSISDQPLYLSCMGL